MGIYRPYRTHIKASLYEIGGALALAALCGVPLGILWGSRQSWLEVVEPLILYAAVVPKIVIFPIFILFLGIGVQSKLAVGAIAAFFPIALLTIAGMREVKKVYVDVARTVGASPMQIAIRVYLPAIAGQVFSGIRIGMGAAVTGALLAETKIAKAGLGFMIVEYYGQFRIADMYSLLLFVFILAALVTTRPRQSRRRHVYLSARISMKKIGGALQPGDVAALKRFDDWPYVFFRILSLNWDVRNFSRLRTEFPYSMLLQYCASLKLSNIYALGMVIAVLLSQKGRKTK